MTNTVGSPGPLDPTSRCRPDEPYFPLVGHDPDAPAAVRFWSDLRRKRITSHYSSMPPGFKLPEEARLDLRRCTDADDIADDMERWRKNLPAEELAALSGSTEEFEVKCTVETAIRHLREAAYNAKEALELLGVAGQIEGLERTQLEEAIRLTNVVAERLTPKRAIPEPAEA